MLEPVSQKGGTSKNRYYINKKSNSIHHLRNIYKHEKNFTLFKEAGKMSCWQVQKWDVHPAHNAAIHVQTASSLSLDNWFQPLTNEKIKEALSGGNSIFILAGPTYSQLLLRRKYGSVKTVAVSGDEGCSRDYILIPGGTSDTSPTKDTISKDR